MNAAPGKESGAQQVDTQQGITDLSGCQASLGKNISY